jgi:hypothetical protein
LNEPASRHQRHAKVSAVPGYVRLVLTLELPRAFAETLSARSIREGKTFEAVLIEILAATWRRGG